MLRQFLQLISSNPVFAIEQRAGLSLALTAMLIFERKLDISALNAESFGVQAARSQTHEVHYNGGATINNVKVYRVHGTMFMHDQFCGPEGMMTLDNQLKAADRNPNIHAHVLDISSPGGEASYTETLANTVANLQKPVVAWVNQLSASAAYWIASGADEIMLSGKSAEVGSIGVLISYLDATRALKDAGFDQIIIKSNLSPDKVKYNFFEPSEEDKNLIATEWLDPLASVFHEAVKEYRPGISEDVLKGDVYMGQKAIDLKLADSFGTLDDAIIKASDMAINGKKKKGDSRSMSLNEYVQL